MPAHHRGRATRYRSVTACRRRLVACPSGLPHAPVADAHPRRNGGDAPKGFNDQVGGPRARRRSTLGRVTRAGPGRSSGDRIPSAACRACTRLPRSTPTCGFRSTWSDSDADDPAPDTTKVIYGVNELDLELAGKTVSEIWKVLEQVFNIPRDAVVTVNGTRVDDDYVVRPGDEIEFPKAAGVKGHAA